MALHRRVTPPRGTTPEFAQMWFRLWEMISKEFSDVGFNNVLWVDQVEGNDTNAERGSLAFKYATIQAALNAAQAGDTVWVSPGTYTETLTWPNVNGVTLRGMGMNATVVTNADANVTLTIAPTNDPSLVSVLDMGFVNTSNLSAIVISGVFGAGGLGDGGLIRLQDVEIQSNLDQALQINDCQNVDLLDVIMTGNDLWCIQVGNVNIHASRMNDVLVDYQLGAFVPNIGNIGVVVDSCQMNDVHVTNLGRFAGSDDNQMTGDLTGEIIDDVDGINVVYGSIMYAGRILGNVDVTFDFDDSAIVPMPLILDEARISGSFHFGLTPAALGTDLGYMRAHHATFFWKTAGEIISDSLAVCDFRGALFDQEALASLDTETSGTQGVFDRTLWLQDFDTLDAGAKAVTYANATSNIPYPVYATGHVDFGVSVDFDNIASLPVQVSLKTDVSVTLTSTAGGAGNGLIAVIRPFD